MPTHTPLPAQFGRYHILEKVGEGGMGAVYLAEDTQLGRRVALKVPHFTATENPKVIERFYREARAAAAIEHPNLCSVHDVGQIDGIHYLTMPFIEGMSLADRIDPDHPWPPRQAAELVRQLATALAVLHQRGLIHRDLKPTNILLRASGEPVIMDFGLARSFTEDSKRLTATGMALGTPAYMSPEQITGARGQIGPATDVYSLGVILYELVTGQLPFVGPLAAVYGQILHGTAPAPSALRPELGRAMDEFCLKAMAKKSEGRYASMAAFAAVLADFLGKGEEKPLSSLPTGTAATMGLVARICPTCGKRLRVPPTMQGRRVKCPGCHTSLNAASPRGTDDTFRSSLPFYRKHGTLLRWVLPLAGVFLLVALGVALWLAMPRPKSPTQVAADTREKPEKLPADDTKKPATPGSADTKPPDKRTGDTKPVATKTVDTTSGGSKPAGTKPADTKPADPRTSEPPKSPTRVPPKESSADRVLAGSYVRGSDPSVLLRPVEADGSPAGYERLPPGSSVYTTDRLMSLPGYLSEVRLKSGASLVLRGSVPQFAQTPEMLALLESVVTLHKPPAGIDLELTYHRGRIYLANRKKEGPLVVRLRFGRDGPDGRGEIWDLKLQEPDTEVGIDFIKGYTRAIDYKSGEGPRFEMYLCVLKGRISLKTNYLEDPQYLAAPPGQAFVMWDNKGHSFMGPFRLEKLPPVWIKQPPTPKEPEREQDVQKMTQALVRLSRMAGRPKVLEVTVMEGLEREDMGSRMLAIYTLGAIDEVRQLIDILGDPDPSHAPDRVQAIFTLRHWISRNSGQGKRLYDRTTDKGILMDLKYKATQAQTILELLHDFPDAERKGPETFRMLAKYLQSDNLAIAELSWYHLQRLAPEIRLPPFNAAAPLEIRERVAEEIRRMIPDKLPPREKPVEPMSPKKAP